VQSPRSPREQDDYVDLRGYLTILRRRAPVIIVIALVFVGLAIAYTRLQTPIYTATAKVLIKPPPGNTTENLNNVISVETEAQVVKSEDIALAAGKDINPDLSATQLLRRVSVNTTPGSFIMAISYSDPFPERAAKGANAFAEAYRLFRNDQYQSQIDQQQQSIEEQIKDLTRQQTAQNEIIQEFPRGTAEYQNAQDTLSQLNIRLAVLASALSSLPQVVDTAQVLLQAPVPTVPSSPNMQLNLMIGLVLGILGGIGSALVVERMDDRVHETSELYRFVDAPVLAYVPHSGDRKRQKRGTQLVVRLQPHGPAAEAYRTIRTGILSMAQRRKLKVLAFVSPVQGEGKSMTCANVAAAIGQTGKRVLTISADIRRPTLHEFLGVPNELGLTEVLEGGTSFETAVQRSEMGGVWVLTGGQPSAGPAELLQSSMMSDLIEHVRGSFDFVILDCPPVLGLADSLAILPLADATMLVVQAGRTQGGALIEANERLARVGVSVDAAIVNDVHVRRGYPGHRAYGYYRFVDDYLDPNPNAKPVPTPSGPPPSLEVEMPDPASGSGSGSGSAEPWRTLSSGSNGNGESHLPSLRSQVIDETVEGSGEDVPGPEPSPADRT
jgi:capsular exopolysaccharide synthesis family protein